MCRRRGRAEALISQMRSGGRRSRTRTRRRRRERPFRCSGIPEGRPARPSAALALQSGLVRSGRASAPTKQYGRGCRRREAAPVFRPDAAIAGDNAGVWVDLADQPWASSEEAFGERRIAPHFAAATKAAPIASAVLAIQRSTTDSIELNPVPTQGAPQRKVLADAAQAGSGGKELGRPRAASLQAASGKRGTAARLTDTKSSRAPA
jgi:hypothetical protein